MCRAALRLAISLLLAAVMFAANAKLYLKDGNYHLVREYQVLPDRVRFYSVERSDWEEIPLELVDLKKTESEIKRKEAQAREERKELAEEDQAIRDQRKEVESIPQEPGVYRKDGGKLITIPEAESKIASQKRRNVLRAMSPIPIFAGKSTVELDGEHSKNLLADTRPEFFIRLSNEERFGILRLTPQKGVRIVEKLNIIPVTKEIVEEQQEVDVFRQQLSDGLYKVWPEKPLAAGEYAVMEYTPATNGTVNIQVWDFSVSAAK